MVCHRPAHDKARVVVHEGGHVEPLVASEQEGEDVRLPHLIGPGALEAPRWVLPGSSWHRRLVDEPLLVQDAAHLRLAHPQCREAGQHVPDAPRAPLGVLASLLDHGVVLDLCAVPTRLPHRLRRLLGHQRLLAPLLVERHPCLDGRDAGTEDPRDLLERDVATKRLLHHA